MDGWHSSIPIGLVVDKVLPERGGGELRWHNHRASRQQRCEEASKQSVNMEQWHHKVCTIAGCKLIGSLDVLCLWLA